MSEPRRLLRATLSPYAAWVLSREGRFLLEALEVRGRSMILAGSERGGRELLDAVGEIREAGKAWRARVAARGSAEVPRAGSAAESAVVGVVPNRVTDLTVRAAADQLGLTERQVRNLVREGRLVGHQSGAGRPWVVDEVSVAAELERRRLADE